MLRAAALFGVVMLVNVARLFMLNWLARRPSAQPLHVFMVCNTILLSAVTLTVLQFRNEGVTLYGIFYAAVMFGLAANTVKEGRASAATIHVRTGR
jgi:hypothetical protein